MAFSDFIQSTPGGAAVSSAGGLLGSVVSGLFANRQQKKQYQYNSKLMSQQNEYSLQQMAQQYEYDKAAYEQQRDDEREYNDPMAVRRRLYDAGYNASAAFDGAAGGNTIDASMSSGGMPSGPSGHGVGMASVPDFGSLGLGEFVSTYNSLKNSEAGRNRDMSISQYYEEQAEGKRLENDSFDETIRNLKADTSSKEARAALDRIEAFLKPLIADASVKNFDANSLRATNEALLLERKYITEEHIWRSLEATIQNTLADTNLKYENGRLVAAKTQGQNLENSYLNATLNNRILEVAQRFNLNQKQIEFISRQISHIDFQEGLSRDELEFQIDKFERELKQRNKEFWTGVALKEQQLFTETAVNILRSFTTFATFGR